jgi:NAD(P)-dependent dehydrogenase (short-subunit alcohol dehydrogenase family)
VDDRPQLNPARELRGATVLVIGGSSGIGLAIAQRACALGASVAIASRSPERLEAARGLIGSDVAVYELDVSNAERVDDIFESVGELDHVVSSIPSHSPVGALASLDLSAARAALDLKLFGNVNVARSAARHVVVGGSITMIAAISSRIGSSGMSLLGAANAAVESLGRNLASELAPIRVNVISPGIVDTDYWAHLEPEVREAMLRDAADKLPTGRVATADDIATIATALMTSRNITGAVVDVDGGMLLH